MGNVSVDLPVKDWLCHKLEIMNVTAICGYLNKANQSGGFHSDQSLKPPKPQAR